MFNIFNKYFYFQRNLLSLWHSKLIECKQAYATRAHHKKKHSIEATKTYHKIIIRISELLEMAKERKNFIYFFLLFSLSVFAQATFVKQNKNAVVKKNFVQSLQSSRDQFYVYHIRYFSIYASDSLFFCFWFVSQPAYIAFFIFCFCSITASQKISSNASTMRNERHEPHNQRKTKKE